MIVARRGASAKYAQGGSLLDDRLMDEMNWAEHKESRKHHPPEIDFGAFI